MGGRVRMAAAAAAVVAMAMVLGSGCSDEGGPEVLATETGFATSVGAAPFGPEGGGLTVSTEVRATLPADQATVVIPAPYDDALGTSTSISTEQREEIRSALGELGIDEDRVRIVAPITPFAPSGHEVQVDRPVEEVAAQAPEVIDAVEDAMDGAAGSGVRFALRDCTAALGPLQSDALEELDADAADLADAAGLELGPRRSLDEAPPLAVVPFETPASPCADQASQPIVNPDAPPEVDLVYAVAGTYEIVGAEEPSSTISAIGSAGVTVAADRARVTVAIGEEYGFGPSSETLSNELRQAVLDGLGEVGIDRGAVRFLPADSYSGIPPRVLVDVDPSRLPDIGEEITDAVEDEVEDELVTSSVQFRTSACEDILGDARAAAVDDARARIDGLAAAAGSSAGDVIALLETVASIDGSLDPCDEDQVPLDAYGLPTSSNLDAPAEVTIRAAVELTAAVEPG